MLSEQSQNIVLERERGDSLNTIARRYGVSHQRVAGIFADATKFVSKIELDLMVARKTGEQVAVLIPHTPDYTLGMQFATWVIDRLRRRDIDLRVETRRAHNGIALLITDVTDYARGGDK
jgi:hypothetical protein